MKKFRRAIVTMPALALGAFVTGFPGWVAAQASMPSVEVWKSPTCGCCVCVRRTHLESSRLR